MIIVPMIALHNKIEDKIALNIRGYGKPFEGYYEFPGGKVEQGELAIEALIREIYEELDITLETDNIYPVGFDDFRLKGQDFLLLLYYCHNFEGEIYGKEGQNVEWVALDKLHETKMIPTNVNIMPMLDKFLND